MKFPIAVVAFISSAYAFSPMKGSSPKPAVKTTQSSVSPDIDVDKPLSDPLGLYPKSAPERQAGLLKPLETNPEPDGAIQDPLNLYNDKSQVDDAPMSASLPFVKQPPLLDGTLPGDRGFDPFNFSSNENALQWYRTAEVKHARLAMLAAVGWPLSELFDKQLAHAFDLKPLLVFQDRVPSVLNGGLSRTPPAYWAAVLGVAFAIETFGTMKAYNAEKAGGQYTPGDLGFDPLGLGGKTLEDKKFMLEAELFNGRLGMLAITGFAIQEWWTQNSVINETPIFFKPINAALEQLLDAGANSV